MLQIISDHYFFHWYCVVCMIVKYPSKTCGLIWLIPVLVLTTVWYNVIWEVLVVRKLQSVRSVYYWIDCYNMIIKLFMVILFYLLLCCLFFYIQSTSHCSVASLKKIPLLIKRLHSNWHFYPPEKKSSTFIYFISSLPNFKWYWT